MRIRRIIKRAMLFLVMAAAAGLAILWTLDARRVRREAARLASVPAYLPLVR